MMTRDILNEISENLLSDQQADEILCAILDSPQAPDIEKLLGFTRTEWTAYGQGATLLELSSWRRNGWPIQCQICGNPISVEKFGWRVIDDVDGNSALKHIKCPAN